MLDAHEWIKFKLCFPQKSHSISCAMSHLHGTRSTSSSSFSSVPGRQRLLTSKNPHAESREHGCDGNTDPEPLTWKDENNDFFAGTPTPATFTFVLALAAKRIALGTSQTIACLDVPLRFFMRRWEMKSTSHWTQTLFVCFVKKTCLTFNHSMMKVSTKWTKLCTDIEAHHDSGRTPCQRQRKILDSLYMYSGNFIQYVHLDGELLCRRSACARHLRKLKQKFLVKKVDYRV